MNAFCASVNFDAFIVHSSSASRENLAEKNPASNSPVLREQSIPPGANAI
jgi:hypothetical protein